MAHVTIRPEFRTAGGEVSDLEIDGKYAGTLTLTYREYDRMMGAIQLDQAALSDEEKQVVSVWADEYVHDLAGALRVEQCEVLVTYSAFDHIVTAYEEEAAEGGSLDDIDPDDHNEILMDEGLAEEEAAEAQTIPVRLELVIVGESGNRVEYHIYGPNKEWLAEAFFNLHEDDAVGEVKWMMRPTEEELDAAADLLVSDFEEEDIDAIVMHMIFEDELLETYELAHQSFLDPSSGRQEKDFTVHLIRDDGDALTYDIYDQTRGGLPIGRATVDISQRKLTGMIDFRQPISSEEREWLASALLRELDKERDYESLSITMMHQNRRIEHILFENEPIH